MTNIRINQSTKSRVDAAIPSVQPCQQRPGEEDEQQFAQLLREDEPSNKKNTSAIKRNDREKPLNSKAIPLSKNTIIKLIMAKIKYYVPEKTVEWSLQDTGHTKENRLTHNMNVNNPVELRIRIVNTRLCGCELHLSGDTKTFHAAFITTNKQQTCFLNTLKPSLTNSLHNILPRLHITFSVKQEAVSES